MTYWTPGGMASTWLYERQRVNTLGWVLCTTPMNLHWWSRMTQSFRDGERKLGRILVRIIFDRMGNRKRGRIVMRANNFLSVNFCNGGSLKKPKKNLGLDTWSLRCVQASRVVSRISCCKYLLVVPQKTPSYLNGLKTASSALTTASSLNLPGDVDVGVARATTQVKNIADIIAPNKYRILEAKPAVGRE